VDGVNPTPAPVDLKFLEYEGRILMKMHWKNAQSAVSWPEQLPDQELELWRDNTWQKVKVKSELVQKGSLKFEFRCIVPIPKGSWVAYLELEGSNMVYDDEFQFHGLIASNQFSSFLTVDGHHETTITDFEHGTFHYPGCADVVLNNRRFAVTQSVSREHYARCTITAFKDGDISVGMPVVYFPSSNLFLVDYAAYEWFRLDLGKFLMRLDEAPSERRRLKRSLNSFGGKPIRGISFTLPGKPKGQYPLSQEVDDKQTNEPEKVIREDEVKQTNEPEEVTEGDNIPISMRSNPGTPAVSEAGDASEGEAQDFEEWGEGVQYGLYKDGSGGTLDPRLPSRHSVDELRPRDEDPYGKQPYLPDADRQNMPAGRIDLERDKPGVISDRREIAHNARLPTEKFDASRGDWEEVYRWKEAHASDRRADDAQSLGRGSLSGGSIQGGSLRGTLGNRDVPAPLVQERPKLPSATVILETPEEKRRRKNESSAFGRLKNKLSS